MVSNGILGGLCAWCQTKRREGHRAYRADTGILVEVRELVAAQDDVGTHKRTAEVLVGGLGDRRQRGG